MSESRYKVSFSVEVASELRRLGRAALVEGRFHTFAGAANWIAEELERTPREFGESRYTVGSYEFRCGFAGPLYVDFAVDEHIRVVFIRRFALVKS